MGAPNGAPKAYCFLPFCHSGAGLRGGGAVKGGVGKIDVFGIHLLLTQPQALAKALEVDDLPLPQEADDVVHIGIIAETQNVIVGDPGLLFWCDSVRTTFSAKVHAAMSLFVWEPHFGQGDQEKEKSAPLEIELTQYRVITKSGSIS